MKPALTAKSPSSQQEVMDDTPSRRQTLNMRPLDIQIIGQELAIKWDDGSETFLPLEKLRQCCPCAGCQGERDVMGNLHLSPPQALRPASFQIVKVASIGGYGLQPVWADGHNTGIYSYDYLRRVADARGN
ncbi:MAG TPA: DUF971 domain-containing protein [Verrucomicrobiae bacterium]